eukprot:jgi/Picre1/28044/NNA_001004.t1
MDVASRFRGCSPMSNGLRILYSGALSSRSVVVRKPKEKGVVKVQAFRDLDLGADVLNAVEALDFDEPTEIQSLVIPKSVLLTGGGEMATQKAALGKGVDVLIGTPSKVVQHAEKGNLFYGDVEVVVLDEADTMMDRGFGPEVEKILKAVQNKPQRARCVLVSATMTKQVKHLVNTMFPKIRAVETTTLHKGVSGSRHTFLPAQGGVGKLDIAIQLVDADYARGQRTMVFCNTLDSCRAVEHYLSEQGIPSVCYHGDVPVAERKEAIAKFSQEYIDASPPILVATDLAARGLDIPGKVDHVVNFDFPLNPVDYLHRTGRMVELAQRVKSHPS